tara:strand:- start:2385 stop:2534 length:150 start_codon:yes stop_codon:yes gene_type:complete
MTKTFKTFISEKDVRKKDIDKLNKKIKGEYDDINNPKEVDPFAPKTPKA